MTRRKKPQRGRPTHVVLDNEALGQIAAGRLSHSLRVDLRSAATSAGVVVLPASVLVERDHDRTAPATAEANRILREASVDALTDARAAEAITLRRRSGERGSVVDAHVAAAAVAVVRRFGGSVTVATSDPSDITRLLDGVEDSATRAVAGVLPL